METHDIVSARCFRLTDNDRRIRAELRLESDDLPRLEFRDENQRATLIIGLDHDGTPVLSMSDGEGQMKIGIGTSKGLGHGLMIYGDSGFPEIWLQVRNSDGKREISLRDETGKVLWSEIR